eukprot:29592-Prymnesium_polylepis.1
MAPSSGADCSMLGPRAGFLPAPLLQLAAGPGVRVTAHTCVHLGRAGELRTQRAAPATGGFR